MLSIRLTCHKYKWKHNMLPEYTDGNRQGRRLTVPNTFDITYMYQGQENQFLQHSA